MQNSNAKRCDCPDEVQAAIEKELAAKGIKADVKVIDMSGTGSPLDRIIQEIVERHGGKVGKIGEAMAEAASKPMAEREADASDKLNAIKANINEARATLRQQADAIRRADAELTVKRERIDGLQARIDRLHASIDRLDAEYVSASKKAAVALDEWKGWESDRNKSEIEAYEARNRLANFKGLGSLVHAVEELVRGRGLGPVAAAPIPEAVPKSFNGLSSPEKRS